MERRPHTPVRTVVLVALGFAGGSLLTAAVRRKAMNSPAPAPAGAVPETLVRARTARDTPAGVVSAARPSLAVTGPPHRAAVTPSADGIDGSEVQRSPVRTPDIVPATLTGTADETMIDKPDSGQDAKATSKEAQPAGWRRFRIPGLPLWMVLLIVSVLCSAVAYRLTPPNTAGLGAQATELRILVWASRPGVHLTVVLDARDAAAMYTDRLTVKIYADTPTGAADLLVGEPGGTGAPVVALADEYTLRDAVLMRYGGNRIDSTEFMQADDIRATFDTSKIKRYELLVTKPAGTYQTVGSHAGFVAPIVDFGGASPPRRATDGGEWYTPTGQIIVLPPWQVADLRTDRATPPFEAQQVWMFDRAHSVRWQGTDPTDELKEQRYLFFAGALLGVAGGGFIATIQEFAAARRRRRECNARRIQTVPGDRLPTPVEGPR